MRGPINTFGGHVHAYTNVFTLKSLPIALIPLKIIRVYFYHFDINLDLEKIRQYIMKIYTSYKCKIFNII